MKRGAILAVAGAAAFACLVAAPFVGMERIPLDAVLAAGRAGIEHDIFWKIRLPRVLTAFVGGAALSVSGMAFQALFRNPLATPFTLGVSSGAAFGAAVYAGIGATVTLFGIAGRSVCAFLGALAAIFLVYGLTRLRHGFSTATMLLAGVAVSFFFSSIILFLQYMGDYAYSFRTVRWLMGGFEGVGYRPVLTLLPFAAVGCLTVLFQTVELNLLTAGEDIAVSRGVPAGRVRAVLFFAVSLMVGGVVAVAGPIGFVGMMSPHICRLIIGYDHRVLAPLSILFGGGFLVVCDTIARTVIAPAEIPVGVITAMLGGPFFIWLLVSGASERSLM